MKVPLVGPKWLNVVKDALTVVRSSILLLEIHQNYWEKKKLKKWFKGKEKLKSNYVVPLFCDLACENRSAIPHEGTVRFRMWVSSRTCQLCEREQRDRGGRGGRKQTSSSLKHTLSPRESIFKPWTVWRNEARTKRDATKGGLWDVICREADPHWKQREKTVTHVVGERGETLEPFWRILWTPDLQLRLSLRYDLMLWMTFTAVM